VLDLLGNALALNENDLIMEINGVRLKTFDDLMKVGPAKDLELEYVRHQKIRGTRIKAK